MTQIQDDAFHAILEAKYARIIEALSQLHGISLEKATEMLYTSETLQLIEDRVADLHCRSDKYLAEEIWHEFEENNNSLMPKAKNNENSPQQSVISK